MLCHVLTNSKKLYIHIKKERCFYEYLRGGRPDVNHSIKEAGCSCPPPPFALM